MLSKKQRIGRTTDTGGVPDANPESHWFLLFELAVLAVVVGFVGYHIPPRLLLLDTMTVGGDTPAHNYIAGHLKDQLLNHGRIVSWAPGWWCGFPLFQFYFCLPYMVMTLLSLVIPFNIAFKLVSVSGIFLLPPVSYLSGRIMRLPRPAPILLAIFSVLMLFDKTHTMWGVNAQSTFAGMIANSVGFPIMLLAISCAYRDATDGVFRVRTVFLLAAMTASHFFTSLMAAAVIVLIPLLCGKGRFTTAVRVLAVSGTLALLLMAWWLIPLFCKRKFSVDFGINWDISLAETLPGYLCYLAPVMIYGIVHAAKENVKPVFIFLWMGVVALLLFCFGFRLSPVFVNVRLWPFIFFSLLWLSAVGLGLLVSDLRGQALFVCAVAASCLVYTYHHDKQSVDGVASIRSWAHFNYSGLTGRPSYSVFRKLVLPLKGTPGRLANDLTDANNAIGSSRIFESVPHLTGKPVLEGGLVNSALTSLFAYYIQGETSENCAGYPTLVAPTSFNLTNATEHLKLFNVKHFAARWSKTRKAMAESPDWRFIDGEEEWQLYELTTHGGEYVFIPEHFPLAVESDRWQKYALEWLYTINSIDQHYAWIPRGSAVPEPTLQPVLAEDRFRQCMIRERGNTGDIDEWLHLGPFHYSPKRDDPSSFTPIDEDGIDPIEGLTTAGSKWHILFTASPISPGKFYRDKEHLVAYSFVNVFCPTEREAVLHYSNDDGVKILLNGEPIVEDGLTGLDTFRTVNIRLAAGRNRLLHKTQQTLGGHFFHVRLTDTAGKSFTDITCSTSPGIPDGPDHMLRRATPATDRGVFSEEVTANRIRFRTDGIGLPHIIKCSYYPNWKVKGAKAIYMVSPAFMLVYPQEEEVELYYGYTRSDCAGMVLTLAGWLAVAGVVFVSRRV